MTSTCTSTFSTSTSTTDCSTSILIHVGTCFGDDQSPTKAVLRLSLATDTGILSELGPPIPIGSGTNPGWLSRYVAHGDNNSMIVYIGMEDDPGMAQAFQVAVEDASGDLTALGDPVSTEGRHPCYCQLDKTGQWLFAANYSSGTVSVISVLPDGSLGQPTDSKHHQGQGPLKEQLKDRQEAPHAHSIIPHPSNHYVVACDLGLSKVFVYDFDANRGILNCGDDSRHLTLPIDAGCRHCCWDATGETLFVVNELNYTVTAAWFNLQTGTLQETTSVYLLRASDKPDRAHHRGGSDVAIHPNGKFLYVGCRSPSPGVIAILQVQGKGADCQLSVMGHESTRGEVPRNFKVIHGGKWIVVANQEGKNVVSYAVDSHTGKLDFKSEISTTPYKACNIASPEAFYA